MTASAPQRRPPRLLRGRLAADEVFPAGRAGHDVRWVELPRGERARLVACEPPPDAAAAAPAVVFVHGWACSAYSWNHVLRPVADAGARVFAPDLRGHGWSDKPLDTAAYTLDAYAEWMERLLDAVAVPRALVVAHSMGSAVALRFARRAPARVAGLVLVAPVGFGAVARARLLRAATPSLVEVLLPRVAFRSVIALGLRMGYGALGAPSARDVDEYWAPTADPRFARVMRRVAHAFEWDPTRPADLAAVACRVHCLFGERDDLVPVDAARPALALLHAARVDVVPQAGHVLPEEAPQSVIRAVTAAARAWR